LVGGKPPWYSIRSLFGRGCPPCTLSGIIALFRQKPAYRIPKTDNGSKFLLGKICRGIYLPL